jgi:hypothetical protein
MTTLVFLPLLLIYIKSIFPGAVLKSRESPINWEKTGNSRWASSLVSEVKTEIVSNDGEESLVFCRRLSKLRGRFTKPR